MNLELGCGRRELQSETLVLGGDDVDTGPDG